MCVPPTDCLTMIRLILHQRDNLEDHARTQHRPAEALWNEAVSQPTQVDRKADELADRPDIVLAARAGGSSLVKSSDL